MARSHGKLGDEGNEPAGCEKSPEYCTAPSGEGPGRLVGASGRSSGGDVRILCVRERGRGTGGATWPPMDQEPLREGRVGASALPRRPHFGRRQRSTSRVQRVEEDVAYDEPGNELAQLDLEGIAIDLENFVEEVSRMIEAAPKNEDES